MPLPGLVRPLLHAVQRGLTAAGQGALAPPLPPHPTPPTQLNDTTSSCRRGAEQRCTGGVGLGGRPDLARAGVQPHAALAAARPHLGRGPVRAGALAHSPAAPAPTRRWRPAPHGHDAADGWLPGVRRGYAAAATAADDAAAATAAAAAAVGSGDTHACGHAANTATARGSSSCGSGGWRSASGCRASGGWCWCGAAASATTLGRSAPSPRYGRAGASGRVARLRGQRCRRGGWHPYGVGASRALFRATACHHQCRRHGQADDGRACGSGGAAAGGCNCSAFAGTTAAGDWHSSSSNPAAAGRSIGAGDGGGGSDGRHHRRRIPGSWLRFATRGRVGAKPRPARLVLWGAHNEGGAAGGMMDWGC